MQSLVRSFIGTIPFFGSTLIIALSLLGQQQADAQNRKAPSFDQVMSSGNAGTEFVIAIPPNEILPFPVEGLEVYIGSEFDTNVELYDYDADKSTRFTVSANTVKALSDRRELNWSMEVREAEVPQRKGLRIKSDKPVTVSVINSKVTTTDAYLAIPTSSWGTEYISVAYSDFREVKPWPAGFMIIAKEPTQVDILLRGSGKNAATTSGGRKIGDRISVFLDEGEVYMVHGDGQTRSSFDLSGSLITSDKPVGVIGFHMRTTMPNQLINGNGRNHLSEMLPPTSKWGLKYSTIELKRTRQLAGRGDVFKVVAKDANTRWNLKYYDKSTGKLLGQNGGLLVNAGDFADVSQAQQPTALTEGFSVWEADKPIFVMQYSCSSSWDGDQVLDPFMFSVCPEEQFITSANFQTPTMAQFTRHYLNLIVKTDTSDMAAMNTNLKSLEVDGVPVWNDPRAEKPSLLLTRMPNGLFWASIELGTSSQAHRITGNGKVSFAGYLFGYGAVDAYGMPLSTIAVNVVRTVDTMPPTIEVTQIPGQCGAFRGQAKELRNIPDPPNATPQPGDQIESGIASIDSVAGSRSFNYQLKLLTDSSFPAITTYKMFRYEWIVIDATKPARVIYAVSDFSGNATLDTLVYAPASTIDTAKPTIELVSAKPPIWDVEVNEKTFSPDPPRTCPKDNDQLDRGLSEITVERVNMRLIAGNLKFPSDSAIRSAKLTLVVEDINLEASAIIVAKDRAGNISRDTIRYKGPTSVGTESALSADCLGVTISADGRGVLVDVQGATEPSTLSLYDLRGQLISRSDVRVGTDARLRLDVPQSGIYLLTIRTATTTCSRLVSVRH
ncbi:MAG: hypothetical protein RIR53_261 [Bacteroidota bacterium]|jgi:hypothetical protein